MKLSRSLYINRPPTASLELSNNRGSARLLCSLARRIRITRNDVQEYLGIINTPESGVNGSAKTLSLDTRDYYVDRLMNKQCNPEYLWNFEGLDPRDILRALIGTLFIVQEKFKSNMFVDPASISNISFVNQTAALAKNGGVYQSTGSYVSPLLTNNDWASNTMGIISSVNVIVTGVSNLGLINLLTNPGFESDLSDWTPASDNYDVTHTDTTTADFDAGTKVNVDTAGNQVILTKTGTDLSYTETTTADFNSGTLINTEADNNNLVLESDISNQTHTDTTTADFDAGTYSSTTGAGDQVRLSDGYANGYRYRKSHVIDPACSDGWWARFWNSDSVNYKTVGSGTLTVDGNWNTVDITNYVPSGGSGQYFNARLETKFTAPETGTFTIYVSKDDGVRIWVDGSLVIDQWNDGTGSFNWTSSTWTYGSQHPIIVEHYQGTGSQRLFLEVSSASISRRALGGPLSGSSHHPVAQTNYQLKFIVHKGTGTDSGQDVYLPSAHCLLFPNDIRFTNNAGTMLDYWIEATDSSTYANIWVEVDSIPTSGATLFIYYGKTSDTSASNSDNTFIFADEFPGTSLNTTTKWTIESGSATVSGGEATFISPGGGCDIRTQAAFGLNTALLMKVKSSGANTEGFFGYHVHGGGDHKAMMKFTYNVNSYQTVTNNGSDNTTGQAAADKTNYHTYEIRRRNSVEVEFSRDGTNLVTTTTQVPGDSLNMCMRPWNSSTGTLKSTGIFVRKLASCELAHSTWGSETGGYAMSGTWTSPADNFDINSTINTSSISWNAGGTGTITVDTKVGANAWRLNVTNGSSIQDLTDNMGMTTIQVRPNLSGSGDTTPLLLDITKSVTLNNNFPANGTRTKDISLNTVGIAGGSTISWNATTPPNTTLTVEASLNGGSTWQTCTNGQPIPGITMGYDCTGKTLRIRETLTTTQSTVTPSLQDLTISILTGYNATGTLTLPGLSLNVVKVAESSIITWTENKPTGTSIIVESSLNSGSSWQACTNGAAIPGVNGNDMTGKILTVRISFATTALLSTPILNDITVTARSENTEYLEIVTSEYHGGSKCLHLKCTDYTSMTEYGVITTGYQTASAGQRTRACLYTLGTADELNLRIKAYNNSNTFLGEQELTLTNLDDTEWAYHSVEYTLPATTAKVKYETKITGASNLYVDDTLEYTVQDEVKIEISRDNGSTYHDALLYWNGDYWEGSYTFTGTETTKNILRYRATLYATNGNANTPILYSVLIRAATISDTGIVEGTLEAWSNPLLEADTITYGFGAVKSRYEGICKIQSITRQDMYIDGAGALNCLNHRGSTLSRTFTVGPDIKDLKYRQEREPMANCVQVQGSGMEDGTITIIPKSSYEDAASIALYERIERKFKAPDINDQEVLNAYTYSLLQRTKIPFEFISAQVKDQRVRDWSLGDTATVVDGTQVTGLNGALRITDEERTMSTSGETVDITFSTRDMDDQTLVKEFISQINSFMGLPQASATLAYMPFKDDCSNEKPCKYNVWIDTESDIKALDLSVWTELFRSTSKSVITAGESQHVHEMPHNHNTPNHENTIDVSKTVHPHTIRIDNGASGSPVYFDGSNFRAANGTGSGPSTYSIGLDLLTATNNSGGSTSGPNNTSTSAAGSSHVHGNTMVFGIYEYPNAAAVKCYINDPTYTTAIGAFGTRGAATPNGTFELINLSLMPYYDPTGSAVGKLGPGSNTIHLVPQTDPSTNPDGLLRITLNIRPKFKN